ncbi:MAG: 5-(carboxyamino)imidazole ribonucleotide synthase [Gammaproteobacteria bacterium]|nr:MAG: 5-(carboxyamino)imidazole ribonucleotide synthase [Gammaproteobacteria bacterium]PIE36876.1 MAG: 5-(carboxyamino)imidazole ribonucleotide synthase [Gammaproteobacteria bacterium]
MNILHRPLLPGTSIGMIGGGQLGRFFVLEARRLGYPVWVLDPDPSAPAMQLADHPLVAAYDDTEALEQLARACAAVSIEFENVPAASLDRIARMTRLAPSADAVRVAQSRRAEKLAAEAAGLRPVRWCFLEVSRLAGVENLADELVKAAENTSYPAILKIDRLGYDGKGQRHIGSREDLTTTLREWQVDCVLEERIELAGEISVVLARGYDDKVVEFPIADNVHRNGILHTSTVPSAQPAHLLRQAAEQAECLAVHLDYVGVMAVEFFIDGAGRLLFNEMAPRPHNSGHYTLDATASSQFEQQLRMLCALPPAATTLLSPVSMLNLLGDLWLDGSTGQAAIDRPHWQALLDLPDAHLHLYGKREARAGRKMAHVNILSSSASTAHSMADALFESLVR